MVRVLAVGLVSCIARVAFALTPALDSFNISDVTVSGLSAGAFMAVQMHVAFSSLINGAAVFAGGPFYCAKGNLMYAEGQCMYTYLGPPNPAALISSTKSDYNKRLIDNPDNLADDKVYLFSGEEDSVIEQAVMFALQDYYLGFMKATNIVGDFSIDAQHCLPTLNYGEACTRLSSPYIGKCNFDGAGIAFQTLFGNDIPKGTMVAANLKEFDQTDFFVGSKTSIGDTGYVYVPTACAGKTQACRLHVSFHGCNQDLKTIGNQYAANTGFNDWAEANNVIVLYPYVVSSTFPSNPNACWDWWAYSGADYAYQSGTQMKFVKDMIDHMMAKKA